MLSITVDWHTDSSFREVPAAFSFLSAATVPKQGGGTFFASLQKGWDALSPDEQSTLYGLDGIHDYPAAYRSRGVDMSDIPGFEMPMRIHPIVRRHPETGRTGLFITEHMSAVEGLSEDESSELLAKLLGVCIHPERIYRHRWSVGDLIIWDNRSMIHRAQGCESRYPRVMHHVRVAGSEPAIAATP
jgi:taurine dioxygenase